MQASIAPFITIIFVTLVLIGAIVLLTVIGIFVSRDAEKRGMNKWMWALIAMFVPNFLGLIIYLIVRSDIKLKCHRCNAFVEKTYEACPFCGEQMGLRCGTCRKLVEKEWTVCPYCSSKLG